MHRARSASQWRFRSHPAAVVRALPGLVFQFYIKLGGLQLICDPCSEDAVEDVKHADDQLQVDSLRE
jgi:hypothetical protein